MPVKDKKKISRPKRLSSPHQKDEGFFKKCADIAVVLNLIIPVMLTILLFITLLYDVAVKNSTDMIYPILYALIYVLVIIGVTLFLYRYFPAALCILFLLNLVVSFYTLMFVKDGEMKK